MTDEMGLFEVMYNCRAMRRIKSDEVPEELLVKLIDAANQAPSGSNVQNGRWIVVRDRSQKERLAELNRKVFEAYVAGPAGAVVLPHQSTEARARMVEAVRWQADHFAEIPALVIACLEIGGAPRRDTFSAGAGAGGSIWPGVQNLLLAARALGLAATPTTFAIADRAAAKAVLGLPETVDPFCLIPVGYPMGNFGPVKRKPVAEIMRWDSWS